jgi:hypothetical protein
MMLANQTGAALACVAHHQRGERCSEELLRATTDLAGARRRLRSRTQVHETIEAALGGGDGAQGITDALHQLTALPVALEDRFGNLRSWSGPDSRCPTQNQTRKGVSANLLSWPIVIGQLRRIRKSAAHPPQHAALSAGAHR